MPRGTATPTTTPRPQWATLEVAAEHIGASTKTVRRMIAAGTVTGYRFGPRMLRVDLNELDALARPIPTAAVGGGAR
jgi:excisionase family DNA binding protein